MDLTLACHNRVMALQWGRSGEGAEDGRSACISRGTLRMLQWGRSGEGAEDSQQAEKLMREALLQWGRSGEGAEDPSPSPSRASQTGRFNGAAPVKERKTRPCARRPTRPLSASMGPLR